MGKRKRTADPIPNNDTTNNKSNRLGLPSSSDEMPCSSGTEMLSKEISSNLSDSRIDIGHGTVKALTAHTPAAHHHYNLGRSLFLKRSRYGHQYFRRNSGSHTNPSTSHGKKSSLQDDRLSFSESGRHAGSDYRDRAFFRPERIRSSSLVTDALSPDGVKMVCGICQKLLRRKPYFLGNSLSSGELAVVAVLVCGHVYHAECLEQKTRHEDRRDPPCPLCSGSLSSI